MPTRLDYPHTKDPKKWSQEEVEEHQASLFGDNPCYYCLADKAQEEKN